ncbi:hypothetical protein PHJA_002909000 [Phtheirospermum japonicum]|uniref:Uncharacterized protein n=1 Tax=Phtheirospermum japonicum TaxID=374723 RepID=A0A830DD69_9LAMI|nr:hypothetical protein PHJA_002909000 [Phtheirospermum japonicum]
MGDLSRALWMIYAEIYRKFVADGYDDLALQLRVKTQLTDEEIKGPFPVLSLEEFSKQHFGGPEPPIGAPPPVENEWLFVPLSMLHPEAED